MISLDLKTYMAEKISTEPPHLIPTEEDELKDFIKEIPQSPGVYKFLDKSKSPLYIGKAKTLNKRVASYFRKSSRSKKIENLLRQAYFIEFALTNTELESLLHEQFLIKELKPKFNVQFKDDKGYPWIKIESEKYFPAAKSFLGKKLDGGQLLRSLIEVDNKQVLKNTVNSNPFWFVVLCRISPVLPFGLMNVVLPTPISP